jgi:hypothetical protein
MISHYVRQLRSRKMMKSDELIEVGRQKQKEIYEIQQQREKDGYDAKEEEEELDMLLVKDIPLEAYMDWIKESHHGLRPTYIPHADNVSIGDIYISELPISAHEIASGKMMDFIQASLSRISPDLLNGIGSEPSTDIQWNDYRVKTPDGGLKIRGEKYPCVVIEVAYSESFKYLQLIVHDWIHLTNHVRISIGVKIFPVNRRGQRRIMILYEDRQGIAQNIEFGMTAAPSALQISTAMLYNHHILPQLRGIEHLEIQLIPLRDWILSEL